MIPVASRTSTLALGVLTAALPLVYLPDILPPIFGYRLFPQLFPPIFDFVLLPRLFLLQSLLLVGLIGWGIAAFRSAPVLLPSSSFTLPLLSYVGLALLSTLWAVNPVESLIQASRIFTFFLLALLAAFALTPAAIRKVCAVWAAAGAAVSCIGIAQYFGWALFDIPTVGNPSATFGYRNFAASYLVVSIPVAAGLAWTSTDRRAQASLSLATVLMALFLAYTRTRGAWVGLGGAFLTGALLLLYLRIRYTSDPIGFGRSPARLRIAILCLLLVILGAGLPDSMRKEGKFRFDERKTDTLTTLTKTFSPTDARGRLTVWRHTLEMVRDHPLFGVGLGSWQVIYPRYDRGDWITDNTAPQRPHNDLLWIASETGLFGLGAYLWLLSTLCTTVWRALRKDPDHPETLWTFGIALGILALVGHSLFSFPRERIAPSAMFWIGLGFATRLAAAPPSRPLSVRGYRLLFGATLGLAAVLLVCALSLTYRHIRFDAHYLQAITAWQQERWSQVTSQADRALSYGPLNYRVLLLKGLAHQQLGNPQAAVQAYTTALRYHPNEGHAPLAAACADLGRYDLAAAHYRRELQLFPRSFNAALGLASTLTSAEEWAAAAEAYCRALEIVPEHPDARLGLGNAYERLNRWEEASEIYRKLLTTSSGSADIYTRLVRALQAGGDPDSAVEAYRQAIRIAPEDPRPHNNLGALFTQQGRLREAEQAYRQAIRVRPDYARAYHNLGDLYAGRGDTRQAVEAYESFLQTWKGDRRFLDLVRDKIQNLKGRP